MQPPRTPMAEKALWITKALLAIELAQSLDSREAILGQLYDAAEALGAVRGCEQARDAMNAAMAPAPHSWATEEHEPEHTALPSEVNDDLWGISSEMF